MASDKSTTARPYAKAAFEFALQQNNLALWSVFLQTAALVCLDPQVRPLLIDPRVTTDNLYELFHGICAKWMDDSANNFLKLLAENNRLNVLPEIALLFNEYRAEQEKTLDVDIISFMELTAEQKQRLRDTLKNRFKREVELHCEIDNNILGGVIVHAGDLVIDGSVLSQLKKMHQEVMA